MKRLLWSALVIAAVFARGVVVPSEFSPLGVASQVVMLRGVLLNGGSPELSPLVEVSTPPVIQVGSKYAAVWVNFRYRGATWRLPMTNGVAAYCLNMPVIPAGTVEYRIEAGSAFDPYSSTNAVEFLPSSSTYYTYVNSNSALPEQRKPNLVAWYSTVFQPGGFTDDNHVTSRIINDFWRCNSLSMNFDGTVNFKGYATVQPHTQDASIRARTFKTVGSVWLKARYVGSDGNGTLIIEKSTSSTFDFGNATVATFQVPTVAQWKQFRVDVNDDSASHYYRVRHPSGAQYGASRIMVKDIVFTPAAADVTITKSMVEHDPGYPSRTDPVTFTITAKNTFAGAPASNISPKLIWRLNKGLVSGAWNTAYMAPIGGDQYQVTLPPLDPGDFQYYYRADFTGYAYTGPLYLTPNTTIVNAADFSNLLDANNQLVEGRSPAVLPDFPDSQFFDLSVDPPVNEFSGQATTNAFSYYSFEITE